jgi:hypothetical protein
MVEGTGTIRCERLIGAGFWTPGAGESAGVGRPEVDIWGIVKSGVSDGTGCLYFGLGLILTGGGGFSTGV